MQDGLRFANYPMANAALHVSYVIAARHAGKKAKKKREASFVSVIPLKSGLKPQMTVLNWDIGKRIPSRVRLVLPV